MGQVSAVILDPFALVLTALLWTLLHCSLQTVRTIRHPLAWDGVL